MIKHKMIASDRTARISVLHVLVIGLSLIMTVSAYQFSKIQIEKRTKARFEASQERTLGLIAERMQKYEDALWSGAAAVQSHGGEISYDHWKEFAANLNLKEKYPGISGIGVIHYLPGKDVSKYLEKQQIDRPGFAIRPAHDHTDFIPITYIEPVETNAAAVGLDLAHETNRRTAALASRDTGKAQITGPIILVQDAGSTPGFLFYAPFYRGETPPTVAERREQIVGAVYAPFVVRELMEGVLAKDARQVRFDIRDDGELIYNEHSTDDALNDPSPMYSNAVTLELYGRSWTLDVRTNLAFRDANSYSQPTFILLGGLMIEILIISLILMMSRANGRAIAYADEVTAALRDESEKLADMNLELEATNTELAGKNDELEQFAYAASHDLKTPIRGIGVLTEIIEEDLEDYLRLPDTNPDIGENLTRIAERVDRMNELINGVMAFSKVSKGPLEGAETNVRSIIEELRADFGLSEDQLALAGDNATVKIDSLNFRRIIENLVGNAINHGSGDKELSIVVTARQKVGRLQMSVADNGGGIDPDARDRIFDVFQTLRVPGGKETTGIGLAIVKKAVERHQGKVSIETTVGGGATFIFDWPSKREGQSEVRSDEAA